MERKSCPTKTFWLNDIIIKIEFSSMQPLVDVSLTSSPVSNFVFTSTSCLLLSPCSISLSSPATTSNHLPPYPFSLTIPFQFFLFPTTFKCVHAHNHYNILFFFLFNSTIMDSKEVTNTVKYNSNTETNSIVCTRKFL